MDIKEIAEQVSKRIYVEDGLLLSKFISEKFAEALIESYKAELLKEVGEPDAYLHQWIEYHPYGDTFAGEPCSAITNDGKPFDKSDTVTPLFTPDQVSAAIIKATKPLEDQLAKAEQRVAEACALQVATETKFHWLDAARVAKEIRSGEWKRYLK